MAWSAWLVSIALSGGNPSFVSSVIVLRHLLASHQTPFMLIPGSHHLCPLWFQLSQLSGDEAVPVGVGRNVGVVAAESV